MLSRGKGLQIFTASRSLLIAEVCAITVCSYLGVFLRVIITLQLKTNTLTDEVPIVYKHFLHNSHFAPNLLGCFIIAVLFTLKRRILALVPMALYTGMTTGFCGSLTTFSSWAYSIAQDILRAGASASITLMIVHLALLQTSLSLGFLISELVTSLITEEIAIVAGERESRQVQGLRAHTSTERNEESSESVLSLEAPPCSDLPVGGSGQIICLAGSPNSTGGGGGDASQANPSDFTHDESLSKPALLCSREAYILLCLALLSTSAVWLLIILWSYPSDNMQGNGRSDLHRSVDIDQLRSIALAPYGALLRYSLWHVPVASPFCEKTVPGLKAPTLTANVLGTLLYSLSASYGTSPVAGLYAHAFQEGFCGSLTTASTLILELHTLRVEGGTGTGAWLSLRYGIISFSGGVLLALIVAWAT